MSQSPGEGYRSQHSFNNSILSQCSTVINIQTCNYSNKIRAFVLDVGHKKTRNLTGAGMVDYRRTLNLIFRTPAAPMFQVLQPFEQGSISPVCWRGIGVRERLPLSVWV